MKRTILSLPIIVLSLFLLKVSAREFVHPGIHQTKADLDYMKSQVLKGEQPWKNAFDSLKANIDLDFEVNPFAHVIRGPYGKPNIGADDLSQSAKLAYQCALMWYITDEQKYADKSIEILNKWSSTLWDFDYNDAKLLAAWTGHQLCNAAEILRNTDSGWKKEGQESFKSMLMTVFYPLMRFYFPRANGNWDGAIIHSILAIAVYMDDEEMYQNALNHFLYGPVNGSIFKYIWPSGQCQETMRDQAHVQLGLGEFAGAARIAFTQGTDLFSIAGNRIALGYEYTASILAGENPQSYGKISERAMRYRDDYEYVYRHYSAKGVDIPYTKIAANAVRPEATISVLTAFRAPGTIKLEKKTAPEPSEIAWPTGALEVAVTEAPEDAAVVEPGQSVQDAVNATGSNGWILLKAGLHTLPEKLKIPSGVTISGEGKQTMLYLDPSGGREAVVNAENNMIDVMFRDLILEAAGNPDPGSDPNSRRSFRSRSNRGGILFLGTSEGEMKNITLKNVTVRNSTYNGVFISGAQNVNIINCDFSENGSDIVPGPKLQHNLLLSHCSDVTVKNCRMVTSPHGSGVALTNCKNVNIDSCEVARNAYYGIVVSESQNVTVSNCLVEGNDRSGIMAEYLFNGSENISLKNNLIHYNNGFGIESYSTKNLVTNGNTLIGNFKKNQRNISDEKKVIMQ
ncbi:right-handed parallel beta-helix repeat-containing protein [Maribellus comscasis]|nr:right-handed parallel beta-helix repeat-containing protein [Maribellus comscasis]